MITAVCLHNRWSEKNGILQVIDGAADQAITDDDDFYPAKQFLFIFHRSKVSRVISTVKYRG